MTYTIAQNLLINSNSNYRRTNYGKHPLEVFSKMDEQIKNNNVYNQIQKHLDKLESNYETILFDLDVLINEARQNYYLIKQQELLLNALQTYTYTVPNKASFITLVSTIATLIADCNTIIETIINNTVDSSYFYKQSPVLDEINTSSEALISKQWLLNYITTKAQIPRSVSYNNTLVCDSTGVIRWE